jgi:hypothetical protein
LSAARKGLGGVGHLDNAETRRHWRSMPGVSCAAIFARKRVADEKSQCENDYDGPQVSYMQAQVYPQGAPDGKAEDSPCRTRGTRKPLHYEAFLPSINTSISPCCS